MQFIQLVLHAGQGLSASTGRPTGGGSRRRAAAAGRRQPPVAAQPRDSPAWGAPLAPYILGASGTAAAPLPVVQTTELAQHSAAVLCSEPGPLKGALQCRKRDKRGVVAPLTMVGPRSMQALPRPRCSALLLVSQAQLDDVWWGCDRRRAAAAQPGRRRGVHPAHRGAGAGEGEGALAPQPRSLAGPSPGRCLPSHASPPALCPPRS